MNYQETMRRLEEYGTAQAQKIYKRHGALPGTNISAYKRLELVNTHRYANGLLQLEYRPRG